jgi:exosortase/archaeosortase family protein
MTLSQPPALPLARQAKVQRWLRASNNCWRFSIATVTLMIVFYAALYHPYDPASVPGQLLVSYLELAAHGSTALLGWLGERVSVQGTTVMGRFPFVVVLDCAALDAQALFAAAVLAFPASLRAKLLGLSLGLSGIWLINVARLALLYFAGASSLELFQVLHEEVMVLVVILAVCALFFAWARWARGRSIEAPPLGTPHAAS